MKVLDKMTVKMDLPSDVLIERLMELQGFCRNRDTMGELTEFWCLENGKFHICSPRSSRSSSRWNWVDGRVVPNGNKADVHIRCCADSSASAWRWVILILDILVIAASVFIQSFTEALKTQHFISILIGLLLSGGVFFVDGKEIECTSADLEIMKNDILQKLDAVKRWDE